jgi:hypothetical protein
MYFGCVYYLAYSFWRITPKKDRQIKPLVLEWCCHIFFVRLTLFQKILGTLIPKVIQI